MEINITEFFNNEAPNDYSNSIANLGINAAKITWTNATDHAKEGNPQMLNNDKELEAMREWSRETGAWEEEEIVEWDNDELNALFIQLVSGDIKENEHLQEGDWEAYDADENTRGHIFKGNDGQIYYYLGV